MKKEIVFEAAIKFKGSIEEFKKVAPDLRRLRAHETVMIDTVPLPEKPRGKARGMAMKTTEPMLEKAGGLMIGTWPTPERSGLMIETVPLPETPPPGVWPTTRLRSSKLLDKIIKDMPRVKINDIDGGMRNPHLHVRNEIVLLDKARFKEFVGQVAAELSKDLLKEQRMPRS